MNHIFLIIILIIILFLLFINFYNFFSIFKTNNIKKNAKHYQFLNIISTCGDNTLNISNSPIPIYEIKCDEKYKEIQCAEAGPYINFIIDNYDNPIADYFFFGHGHETAWHYINPYYDKLRDVLDSKEYLIEDYGGIECVYNTCPTINSPRFYSIYNSLFINTTMENNLFSDWQYPCCGTFFMNSKLIKTRPKSDYIQLYNRMMKWNLDIYPTYNYTRGGRFYCSRIYESSWHIMFANKSKIKIPSHCKKVKYNECWYK